MVSAVLCTSMFYSPNLSLKLFVVLCIWIFFFSSEPSFNFSSTLLIFLLTLKFILLIIRSNNCIWFDKKKGGLKVVKSWLHLLISGLVEQSSWTTSKIKSKANIQLLKLWSTLRENSQLADTNKAAEQLIKFKSIAFTWGWGRGEL